MTGWTIRVTHDYEDGRERFWVLTAYMQGVNVKNIFFDPVYMAKRGHTDIKWIGIDALGAWGSFEQAECYIEELGGTKKLGYGYITEENYEYIYSIDEEWQYE